jgi:hypothetical protein
MLLYPRREDHKLHEDYEELKCCANCDHMFEWYEHDGGVFYYCHIDKSKRPGCCSVAMGELYSWDSSDEERSKYMDEWDEWASKRQVQAWGLCPDHKEKCYTEDGSD